MSKVCRERELHKFRCWIDKQFAEGRLNNISKLQHIIDVYLKDMELIYSQILNKESQDEN